MHSQNAGISGIFCEPDSNNAAIMSLVAFHPRPQIASDLGRNVTRSSNPHLKSQAIPKREWKFCLMAADSNRSRPQPAAIWDPQAQPALRKNGSKIVHEKHKDVCGRSQLAAESQTNCTRTPILWTTCSRRYKTLKKAFLMNIPNRKPAGLQSQN